MEAAPGFLALAVSFVVAMAAFYLVTILSDSERLGIAAAWLAGVGTFVLLAASAA